MKLNFAEGSGRAGPLYPITSFCAYSFYLFIMDVMMLHGRSDYGWSIWYFSRTFCSGSVSPAPWSSWRRLLATGYDRTNVYTFYLYAVMQTISISSQFNNHGLFCVESWPVILMEPVSVLRFNTTKRGHVEEGRIHVQGTACKKFFGGGVLTSCVDLDKHDKHSYISLQLSVVLRN